MQNCIWARAFLRPTLISLAYPFWGRGYPREGPVHTSVVLRQHGGDTLRPSSGRSLPLRRARRVNSTVGDRAPGIVTRIRETAARVPVSEANYLNRYEAHLVKLGLDL